MAINQNPSNMNRLFQTASQGQNQQQGTGYTNLNRLFQANKDNQLGQKVAGDIQNQVSGVQGQLKQQQEQFNKQSQQEASKFNEGERNAIIGRFSSADQAGGDITDEDVNKVQTFRSGEYKGPQDLGDTSALSQQASGIAQQVSNFNPTGTQELLRRSVGGNRYTAGQSRLDSLLMDKSKLQPVARQASGLGQQLNQANVAAQGQAQTLKNQAQQFGQQTNEMLQSGLQNIDTGVQAQLKAAQDAETARQNTLRTIEAINRGYGYTYDDSGKIKTDEKGNVIKGTDYSALDSFGKMKEIENQLRGKITDEELNKLFGSTGVDTTKQANIDAFNNIYNTIKQQNYGYNVGNQYQQWAPGVNYLNRVMSTAMTGQDQGNQAVNKSVGDYNNLDNNLLSAAIKKGLMGTPTNQYGQTFYVGAGNPSAQTGNISSSIMNSLLQKSALDQNSAKNITDVGVASDAARKNYETLTKLLGKTASESKYRTDADKYQQGKLILDADQIRSSLGF